jgi:4-oxalocrotonate tautomerase family enzyme
MSGGLPDAHAAPRRNDRAIAIVPARENVMFLIRIKFIDGVLTNPQKREMVEQLTNAVAATAGENIRQTTWCVLEEVSGDGWNVGGQAVTPDDVRALARNGGSHG